MYYLRRSTRRQCYVTLFLAVLTDSRRQQRPLIPVCSHEAKWWCSQEKEKMLSSSSEAQVLKNKHAAVPKPFHILKRRQSTNLWIGRLGTPVTNVISAWHRGFKPIQPPTHRPLLRLCHHNPQAGFLLPRWAGDSMCEQNSSARAASEIIIYSWHDNRGLDSRSVVTLYVHTWGLGSCNSKGIKNSVEDGLCFHIGPHFLPLSARRVSGKRKQTFFWVDW